MKKQEDTERVTVYKTRAELLELEEEYGIKRATLYARLQSGRTLEEAIAMGASIYTVTVEGKEYRSVQEASDVYGISADVIRMRLQAGYTLDEAFEQGKSYFQVTVFGKEHLSMTSLADYYGIDYMLLSARVQKGYELEKAVTELLETEPVMHKGEVYRTLTELCNEYSISISAVGKRLKRGWSLTDAVSDPVQKKNYGGGYRYKGEVYDTKQEAAIGNGITANYIAGLELKTGLDFLESLKLVDEFLADYAGDRPPLISQPPFIIYNGKWINTLKDFCGEVGVTAQELKLYQTRNNCDTYFDALTKMRDLVRVKWVDNATGERATVTQLERKYKNKGVDLEKMGLVTSFEVRTYPGCTFKQTGYCATPKKDFTRHLDTYK